MNPSQLQMALEHCQVQLKDYAYNKFPSRAGQISLRFIDSNFRDQYYHGGNSAPWAANRMGTTILVATRTLRRGSYFRIENGTAHVMNDVPYGQVHNNGFQGTVQVKGFQRWRNMKKGASSTAKISNVKGFTRKMNMPQRKFFPTTYDDSDILRADLINEITGGLKAIFANQNLFK
jgi:phage gpG-like protein